MKITITKPGENFLNNIKIFKKPLWEHHPAKFNWKYNEKESCYIIDGEAIIVTSCESIIISKGDFLIFPEGLKCTWEILKTIRKHYYFD